MKQNIIKGITLLVFASFIGVFVWYNVQKTDNKAIARPEAKKTFQQPDSLVQDSLPVAADGTETKEAISEKQKTKTFINPEAVGTRVDDPPVHMMAGSKSAIIAEPFIEEPVKPFILKKEQKPVPMMSGSKSMVVEPFILEEEKEPVRMMGGSKSAIMIEQIKFELPNPHAKKKKK